MHLDTKTIGKLHFLAPCSRNSAKKSLVKIQIDINLGSVRVTHYEVVLAGRSQTVWLMAVACAVPVNMIGKAIILVLKLSYS